MATQLQDTEPDPVAASGAPARGDESALVGQVFDRKFLIQRLIGVGGFGAVYAARDLQLECGVAIKVLHRDVAADAANLEGFLDEVRRLTRLKHPNVVGWKALTQTDDGSAYLVMELLEGRELADLLVEEATLPPLRAARILLQILDALRSAHRLPDGDCLLHLDLKPANVFLELHPSGRRDLDWVKVIDFGISQYLGADAAAPADAADGAALTSSEAGRTIHRRVRDAADDGNATQMLAARGGPRCLACTPDYAAPEQAAHMLPGEKAPPLDERADLYSVGVIGFRMVTGRLPFGEDHEPEALLRAKLATDPPPVESLAPRVPRRLARFIDRCLRRDRDARFRTADEAYAALEPIANPKLGRKAVALGATVASLLGLSGWLMQPKRLPAPFDLYEAQSGGDRLLTDKIVHLGPGRRTCDVRIAGVELAPDARLRLVADPTPAATALDGWTARAVDGSHVQLQAQLAAARVRRPAYLEVERQGGERRYSRPFELTWLGEAAVALGEVDVPLRGGRRVDPDGSLDLQIHVKAEPEDLERVEVEYGAQRYEAEVDRPRSRPPDCVFRLPLRTLRLAGPRAELKLHVVDRTGCERQRSFDLDVVPAPLAFAGQPELIGAQRSGSRWIVSDLALARLPFRLSGEADVEAQLFGENGSLVAHLSLTKAAEGDFALASFDLDQRDHGFTGSIELRADDSAYVLRSDGATRGVTKARIDFFCSDAKPTIAVDLSDGAGLRGRPLSAEQPCFTNSHRLAVGVTRSLPVPVRVAVVDRSAAGRGAPEQETKLVAPSELSHVFDVALEGDGVHELSIRCWRCVDDDDRKRPPDVELTARCVVDSTAPTLEAVPVESEESSQGASVWPASAQLRVREEQGDAPPTPIHLRFELARENRPTPLVAEGAIQGVVRPGDALTLRLPLPADVTPAAPVTDGRYLLRVFATDEAGNEARPVELAVEAAAKGPTLELKRPVPGLVWEPDATGSYEVRAITEDANGVAAATATLSIEGASPIEVALVAENVSADRTYAEWSGRARIPRTWSSRELELHCRARDRRGRETSIVASREAGTIERSLPLNVHVRRGGAELGPMRLVRGNHDSPYVFGGRADDTEEKLFGAVGLGAYNRLKFSKSWESPFAVAEIPDYYLDEREVTAGEFLRFVDDDRSFGNAALWKERAPPGDERRRALQALLRNMPADAPVVQVTWDEAAAFARWCGKRLPSFVEWEYALRGGPLYRACASGRPPPAARDAARNAAPLPAGIGNDVTPDSRIWNLTGNVAEWSATPAGSSDEREAGSPGAFAASHPAWFQRQRSAAETLQAASFWVVGASYRHTRAEFSIADQRPRDWHGPDVGFRCAAALDDVLNVLEVNDPGRPLFTEEGGG